jgi:hypothetical protein
MRPTQLASLFAVIAMISGLLLGGIVSAATASATKGGIVHVFQSGGGGTGLGTVLLTGAIADAGSSQSIDANGTVDPNNATDVNVALVHGSFRLNTQALNKTINKAFNNLRLNASTCSGYIAASGPATIVSGSGTGAYKGISGSISLNFTYAFIDSKNASGKQKGQCNQSSNAPYLEVEQIVTGSGTVSF